MNEKLIRNLIWFTAAQTGRWVDGCILDIAEQELSNNNKVGHDYFSWAVETEDND